MRLKVKRSYPAVFEREESKWFTGYQGDIDDFDDGDNVPRHETSNDHGLSLLRLRYAGYSRGRSAANILMEDEDGYQYQMSMSGFDILMRVVTQSRRANPTYDIEESRVMGGGTWWEGPFIQVKQGQNYFIEPAEVN